MMLFHSGDIGFNSNSFRSFNNIPPACQVTPNHRFTTNKRITYCDIQMTPRRYAS
jgi:hypothetical protein